MKYDSYVILLFYPLLLIDSINGFFMLSNIPFPISQIYKIFLIFVISLRLISLSPKLFAALLFFLVLILLQTYLLMLYKGSADTSIMTMPMIFLKFYLFLLCFFYFKLSLANSFVSVSDIKNICLFNFFVIAGNIFIGLMGFGFPVYTSSDSEVSVGIKGFFFAGNELSAVYLLLTSMFLAFYARDLKRSYLYFILLVLFLMSATMATKTAIGGMLILAIATIIYRKKYIDRTPFNFKNIFLVSISVLSITVVSVYLFTQSAAFERMKFYFEEFSNIYKFLMSGRDDFLARKLHIFISENNFFKFMLGMGETFSVEIDPFDTFFKFGLIGFFVIYLIYFYLYRRVFSYYFNNNNFYELSIINLALMMVFFQSFISGHVLFSGMLGPFYGMVLSLSYFSIKITKIKSYQ